MPYSFRGIRRSAQRIALWETHWDRFFRSNGIEPVEVVYEDLCADFDATVASVLDRIVPGASAAIPRPDTARQADARSEELLRRYLGDLDRHHPNGLRERIARRLPPRYRGLVRRS